MKLKLNVEKLINSAEVGPSKWELDNITWHDRATDPQVLLNFLKRIRDLQTTEKSLTKEEKAELKILIELANDLDESDCKELLSNNDVVAQNRYIEYIARKSALEALCDSRVSVATMEEMCKLSPEDFILASKRAQDLMNSIKELILQGETLSQDMAGA
jgi:hypothetical protein